MSLLTVADQVTTCLLDPLCESQGSYAPKNNRLPRSVWYNTTSLAYRHDGACRLAVEAAEEHSFRIHQLMTRTSRGLCGWWDGVCRNGSIWIKVRIGEGKGVIFSVKLPVLSNMKENVTLDVMQYISVKNTEENWTIIVRVGLGYVLARALRDMMEIKSETTKKGKAILEMTLMIMQSLKRSSRLFEIKKSSWTKEIKQLVRSKWGWKNVFGIREDNAASRDNERCVVILLDPAQITDAIGHKCTM